ncbi:MAG: trypsin-like peptidase domain-containing protein [Syntrophomonadaceae bacterium]|nr:trypsin-like peptidase domain-containing protein [Syntrophomonadaceae bacterium]
MLVVKHLHGSKTLKLILAIILLIATIGGFLVYKNGYWGSDSRQKSINPDILTNNSLTIGSAGIADMVEKVSPAVVNIETTTVVPSSTDVFFNDPFFRDFFGNNSITPRQNIQKGIGSGFLISENGYILTNQHVIDNASNITIHLANDDTAYNAQIAGQDYELDLAVLKIDSKNKFSTLVLGDSNTIRAGEWVVAIGNPYGLDHTVTVGVVSAQGRPVNIENRVYKNLIQTDAAINPGNSGGPLLNIQGEVIGINTAVNAKAQGIGFAISINTAKEILNELIEKGKVIRPYMGIWLQPMNDSIAAKYNLTNGGVIISEVLPGGPAEQAGLKKNDIITSLDEKSINSYEQLQEFLKTKQVGSQVTVKLIRSGQVHTVAVILAEKP